ncbi:MAG: hypothetical protein ACKPEA_13115, partial [Planctomycetota bacterium]
GSDHERRAARSEELARQAAEAQQQRVAAMAAETEAAQQAQAIASELSAAIEQATAASDAVRSIRDEASRVERDHSAIEISRREAEVRREGLEESTFEELGIDLPAGYEGHVAARAVEGFAAPDRDAATTEADQLRDAIKALGNVNMRRSTSSVSSRAATRRLRARWPTSTRRAPA